MGRAMNKAQCLLEMERLYLQRAYSDAEIAQRLGIDRTTAYRYRMELSNGENALPIEPDANGKWKINRTTYLSNVRVNLYESLILYLAARRATQQGRLAGQHAASALEKISLALRQPLTEKLVKAADKVLSARVAPERVKIFETIARGWAERIPVRITYRALRAAESRVHVIHPYLIEPSLWSDSVYAIAYSETSKIIIPFKIERIARAALATGRFDIPADFDEDELLKHAWGVWTRAGEPVTVQLRFAPGPAARRLRESTWHPLEKVTDTEDGGCIWEAPIAEPREMLPWIRGWGADVEVLAPESLRKALERETKRLARVYGISQSTEDTGPSFYAHSRADLDESEWQLLKDHLTATAELAAELAKPAGLDGLAYTAGLLHDIGKYSPEFQARLRGAKRRVDHATAGAREIVKLFPTQQENYLAELVSYCIAGHHTGLPDYGSAGDLGEEGTLLARREKKRLPDYSAYRQEIDLQKIALRSPTLTPARFRLRNEEKQHALFSIAFMTRMLFSALVDADWLETERYMEDEDKPRGGHASITELAAQFNRFLKHFENPTSEINRRRTETLHACIEKATQPPGFFTLTVPTGGGKTFASMAFALNHAAQHGLRRVIYVIPFTSIIEQNAEKFREALGPLGTENVLEHHSNFDWEKIREDDNETNQVEKKLRLAAENWDVPIVVTTSVQFFESLFASKKRPARKLHNIAQSVIIFDEVQTLPRDYLKPSLLAVQELVRNYGCTAVFCTATQPSLERFFPKDISLTELAPNPQELYRFYRRVDVKNLGELTDEDLLERLNEHDQALCIVNTRRHASGLYKGLTGEGNFHLSTLMCPAHRRKVLEEIRRRLREGEPCRVVSTSVMEAGIDIDFPVGYRALAGLDSILQAAGRVNREMKRAHGEVFVFTPKSKFIRRTPTFIAQTGAVARSILRDHAAAPNSLDAIAAYYDMLYNLQSEEAFDTHRIVGAFEKSAKHPAFDFETAAENFRFIQQNSVSVLIPYDERAKTLIERLQYALHPGRILRQLQVYTVNIYEREFERLQSKGVIWTIAERYHVLDEGRMAEFYSPETGLLLPDEESGDAIFFDG